VNQNPLALRIRSVLRSAEPLDLGGEDGGVGNPRGTLFSLLSTGDAPPMPEPWLANLQWRERVLLFFSCCLQDARRRCRGHAWQNRNGVTAGGDFLLLFTGNWNKC
jgi:hypothetical protein